MERGRTELLADRGFDVAEYHHKGYFFPVIHVDIHYKRPAKLGETIEVASELIEIANASITFKQEILRDDIILVESTVKLACIGTDGKPRRLPSEFRSLLSSG